MNDVFSTAHPARRNAAGRVTLVGAGPGDVELLTLKAINAIKQATVLLVDDLVNPGVLAYASPRARVVPVGKRGGCTSTPQSFIEKLMIIAAHDGENVVRLKGGDPFVFGRGGEEVEHLTNAGVMVEVINGITSGLAACTSLGIPLTHRAHAHGVVFVTGHNRPGDAATNWASLAAAAHACQLTLVIYMGISGVGSIQQGLLSALPAETPAAVIQRATLPDQKSICCTLDTLKTTITNHQLESPSIIVVGDVVRAANTLAEQPALPSAMAA